VISELSSAIKIFAIINSNLKYIYLQLNALPFEIKQLCILCTVIKKYLFYIKKTVNENNIPLNILYTENSIFSRLKIVLFLTFI
jgi:hypothetical protein